MKPSIQFLNECLQYREGKLYWRHRPKEHFSSDQAFKAWNTKYAYIEAGTISGNKCIILINKKVYYRPILVWALHNNKWPVFNIDHKNNDILDDRIENLKEHSFKGE